MLDPGPAWRKREDATVARKRKRYSQEFRRGSRRAVPDDPAGDGGPSPAGFRRAGIRGALARRSPHVGDAVLTDQGLIRRETERGTLAVATIPDAPLAPEVYYDAGLS
jgi:hypothetical protein